MSKAVKKSRSMRPIGQAASKIAMEYYGTSETKRLVSCCGLAKVLQLLLERRQPGDPDAELDYEQLVVRLVNDSGHSEVEVRAWLKKNQIHKPNPKPRHLRRQEKRQQKRTPKY